MAPGEPEAASGTADARVSNIEQIRAWLRQRLQEVSRLDESIRDDMSFDYIGLDSLARVDLVAEVEERFSLSLDPTAAYDFVTVGALSEFIWGQITGIAVDEKKLLEI